MATIQPAGWGGGQDVIQVVVSPSWVLERLSGPCLVGHSHLLVNKALGAFILQGGSCDRGYMAPQI